MRTLTCPEAAVKRDDVFRVTLTVTFPGKDLRLFEFAEGYFGLDQCQARLHTSIRHLVLVMAALAICAVTAARLHDRTGTQAPPPATPDQAPLTVHEIQRLLAAELTRPQPP